MHPTPTSNKTTSEKGQGLIVCGTYEKLLYGLNIEQKSEAVEGELAGGETAAETGGENNMLKESFIYPSHLSSISCVAIGTSKYLATGSNDENVKLYGTTPSFCYLMYLWISLDTF